MRPSKPESAVEPSILYLLQDVNAINKKNSKTILLIKTSFH